MRKAILLLLAGWIVSACGCYSYYLSSEDGANGAEFFVKEDVNTNLSAVRKPKGEPTHKLKILTHDDLETAPPGRSTTSPRG